MDRGEHEGVPSGGEHGEPREAQGSELALRSGLPVQTSIYSLVGNLRCPPAVLTAEVEKRVKARGIVVRVGRVVRGED